MKAPRSHWLAGLLILLGVAAYASTRPHYGGTARMLVRPKITSIDPAAESDYPAERDRLSQLVFETLTTIDAQGHLQPLLASGWQPDAAQRVWQFQLRPANFQDGTAVTSAAVVASLKAASPEWKVTAANRQLVAIETPFAAPHLPEMLSLQKFAIIKKLPDNTLTGSGPYKVSQWQAGERGLFTANEDYWGGRPYLDSIEVQMGVSLREHLLERSLGHDQVAELGVDQLRALEQTSQNIGISRPSELLVLMFLPSGRTGGKRAVDPKIREALSDAVNRTAISNVLLQRRSVPATGLLPQWLTGYEFMLGENMNPEQARKLRAEIGNAPLISVAYDFSDPIAKMVADRIAVDAREIGLLVQPYNDSHVNTRSGRKSSSADAVLLRLPLKSLEPSVALAALAEDLDESGETTTSILSSARSEDLFAVERKMLESFRIVPVAHLSQALWLNSGIHNWQQLVDGEWKLDQVWMEGGNK